MRGRRGPAATEHCKCFRDAEHAGQEDDRKGDPISFHAAEDFDGTVLTYRAKQAIIFSWISRSIHYSHVLAARWARASLGKLKTSAAHELFNSFDFVASKLGAQQRLRLKAVCGAEDLAV